MPEGDTIFRTAEVLRRVLVGKRVTAARAVAGPLLRRPPDLDSLIDRSVVSVEARGKHLLMAFEATPIEGASHRLTLRTHMRMTGSWHRYRTGEPWRLPMRRASIVLEAGDAVAVCFDCPVAELLTDADVARSRPLRTLGPDLLSATFGDAAAGEAIRRLRSLRTAPIGEALLDQRALAGIGNVVRNEVLFMERVNPLASLLPRARSWRQALAVDAGSPQASIDQGQVSGFTAAPVAPVAAAGPSSVPPARGSWRAPPTGAPTASPRRKGVA